MKPTRGLIIGGIVAGVLLLLILISVIWTVSAYNNLVSMEEDVDGSWAQVENKYQQKVDLIPTLVATVEDYQDFEDDTLTNITRLRTQWMEAGSTEDQVKITNDLDMAINVMFENYPTLRSIEAVDNLMISIEGMEARIAVERMRYNDNVRDYNKKIKQFPTVLVANSFGFEERSYFESDAAPDNP
ncbi:MAG: LemA family protein [Thermoplasmatota archaeon]